MQTLNNLKSLLSQERFDSVINLSLQALDQSNDSQKIIEFLSFSFFKRGLFGAALACQSRLLKLNPTHVNAYKNIIKLYQCLLMQKNERLASLTSETSKKPVNVKKVIILCGGDSYRWQGYIGVMHKPLIPVMGERLLARTIRQVRNYFLGEIDVLIRSEDRAHYEYLLQDVNIKLKLPSILKSKTINPTAKYLASLPYWSEFGDTVILLGDVWFSDFAIESVFTKPGQSFLSFGRYRQSTCTGYPYGNFFAIRLDDNEDHKNSLVLLDRLYKASICTAHGGGWAWTQINRNEDPNIRSLGENFIDINDFTDDFDSPADYERWITHFKIAHP